jgi:tripartite-type tricarboxylate transporter receptor subunit TctC
LNFSSSGTGGISHLVAELFNSTVGIQAVHIPYKGSAPAMTALLGGEAQYLFNNLGASQPQVLNGSLRGYAITAATRNPSYPDIPTFAELGVPGMEVAQTWFGMVGPPHMPPAIVSKLNAEIARIMHAPDVTERATKEGYEIVVDSPEEFTKDVKAEVAAYSRIIREKGIKAE